jgi:hypothetical protein
MSGLALRLFKTSSTDFGSILPLAPTEYRIELHAVYEQDRRIQDLFVVEIVVPIATHKYLYSTGNGQVYIKTDAGKKRLRPIEIQEEILKRHKVKS